MPTTLGQVVVFLLLGLPGLMWLHVRERRLPRWTRSALREIAEFVTISAGTNGFGLGLSLWLWEALSSFSARSVLSDLTSYYRREPPLTLAWLGTGLLIATVLSIGLAYLTETEPQLKPGKRNNLPPWYFAITAETQDPPAGSDGLVEADPSIPSTLIICYLDDGTQIAGLAGPYTDDPGLEGKRDIVLRAPTVGWPEGHSKPNTAIGTTNAVINEQHIRWLTTTKLTPDAARQYVAIVRMNRSNPPPSTESGPSAGPSN